MKPIEPLTTDYASRYDIYQKVNELVMQFNCIEAKLHKSCKCKHEDPKDLKESLIEQRISEWENGKLQPLEARWLLAQLIVEREERHIGTEQQNICCRKP